MGAVPLTEKFALRHVCLDFDGRQMRDWIAIEAVPSLHVRAGDGISEREDGEVLCTPWSEVDAVYRSSRFGSRKPETFRAAFGWSGWPDWSDTECYIDPREHTDRTLARRALRQLEAGAELPREPSREELT